MKWWEILIDILKNAFTQKAQVEPPQDEPPARTRNERVLAFASQEIGVKEKAGKADHPRIRTYHAYASVSNKEEMADSVPWCASFVCFCLESVGMGSSNSRAARSFLRWGQSSRKDPLPGDVVLFWRGSIEGWTGHVGFFIEETKTHIYCLGGNQSDSVNVARYSKNQLLDIRRSSKHEPITPEVRRNLLAMAKVVKTQNAVDLSGKQI